MKEERDGGQIRGKILDGEGGTKKEGDGETVKREWGGKVM